MAETAQRMALEKPWEREEKAREETPAREQSFDPFRPFPSQPPANLSQDDAESMEEEDEEDEEEEEEEFGPNFKAPHPQGRLRDPRETKAQAAHRRRHNKRLEAKEIPAAVQTVLEEKREGWKEVWKKRQRHRPRRNRPGRNRGRGDQGKGKGKGDAGRPNSKTRGGPKK